MISKIDHRIVSSFIEYLDNKIISEGSGFKTVSTGFFPSETRNTQVYAYSAPFKSFIYDKSISQAIILSGISGNNIFYNRTSGISIDYINGRILSSTNLGNQVSGTFSLREFNIKYTSKNEDEILMETKYITEPIQSQTVTGIAEDVQTVPLIYVTYKPGNNIGASFGGLRNSKISFTCYVMALSAFQLDAALSIIRDFDKDIFGLLETNELPLNISGDLKDINYNYNSIISSKQWPNICHIEDINTSKLTFDANAAISPNIQVGICDINCSVYRYK